MGSQRGPRGQNRRWYEVSSRRRSSILSGAGHAVADARGRQPGRILGRRLVLCRSRSVSRRLATPDLETRQRPKTIRYVIVITIHDNSTVVYFLLSVRDHRLLDPKHVDNVPPSGHVNRHNGLVSY